MSTTLSTSTKKGQRYVNEDNRRDVLAQGALNQTDKVFFVINDQTEIDSVQDSAGEPGLHG